MAATLPLLTDILIMTDYSAIEKVVGYLANPTNIQSICQNQMSPNNIQMLINRIDGINGNLCNVATYLQRNKNLYLHSFTTKNYQAFLQSRTLLTISAKDDFTTGWQQVKKEWNITEIDDASLKTEINRNGYTAKQQLMDKLYPEKNIDSRFHLIKTILFMDWILAQTILIINNVLQEEACILNDKDKCLEIWQAQKEILQQEADKRMNSLYFKYDSTRAASNPLVMALHGKESAESVKLLYQKQREGEFYITEEHIIEYIIYEKLRNQLQHGLGNDERYYESLELVHGDVTKNNYTKQVIHDLPNIFNLKQDEKGKYKIRGNDIAFIIIKSGENAKTYNTFNYMTHRYHGPTSFGNISATVKTLKEIHAKSKQSKPNAENLSTAEKKLEQKYQKFWGEVSDYYREHNYQNSQPKISLS